MLTRNPRTRTVIYARYSSNKQDEDSIEAQLRACREYALSKGYEIIGTYVDEAISGKGAKTASRRQYQKMLRDADAGKFDIILIHKYDRVARNVGEHANLEMRLTSNRVALIAVAQDFGTSKEAKIMRALMWSLSEYYIDNLSEEVKKGHQETALKGLHNGGYAPFGYEVIDQEYHIVPFEAAYVQKMFDRAYNREGFRDLIEEMDKMGVRGRRGKPIKYTQIYEILRNEKYTGVYLYSPNIEGDRADRREKPNAIRIEGVIPPIIPKEVFIEVQTIMNEKKHIGSKGRHLCSGLVYCTCGAKMHAMITHRKGHEYRYYTCSKKCGVPTVKMDEVDQAAVEYLRDLLSDENQQQIASALRKYRNTQEDRDAEFKAALKQKIKDKQKEYDTLLTNLSTGVLPPVVVADMGQRMQELNAEIAALEQATPPLDYTADQIKSWLSSLKNAPDDKAVNLLIERIERASTDNEKTAFNITSTLKTVLTEVAGKIGRGDRI